MSFQGQRFADELNEAAEGAAKDPDLGAVGRRYLPLVLRALAMVTRMADRANEKHDNEAWGPPR